MLSATVANVDPLHRPVVGVEAFSKESASTLSRLMTENHAKHNIFFNVRGFHNHIGHHLVTLYALGATPEQIEHGYRHNAQYQQPMAPENAEKQSKLSDPAVFMASMGDRAAYHDFLSFFTTEVETLGIKGAVEEYIFKGDERAEMMYTRLFASIVHSFIHLGLAIEFDLPPMVAEALAWTAVHRDETGDFLRSIVRLSEESGQKDKPATSLPSLISLLREEAANAEVRTGVTQEEFVDQAEMPTRARSAIEAIAAKYVVPVDQVEARAYEAINAISYMTIALQLPPYTPKIDFFMVHFMNASVFLPALTRLLEPAHAARLVESLVHCTLYQYGAMAAPEMRVDYYLSFERDPERKAKQYRGTDYPTWESVFKSTNGIDDDGHISKAVRALKGAELAVGRQSIWEEPLKKEDILPATAVLVRSLEAEPDFVKTHAPTKQWVRGCGFPGNWEGIAKI